MTGSPAAASAAPPVDLAGLARAVTSQVPLNRHLGVRVTELTSERATAALPADDNLGNHVGTVHAAALFLVAETAAGAAFVAAFAASLSEVRFVMRHAEIDYQRPARGSVHAIADAPAQRHEILARVRGDGRAVVPVTANVIDDNGQIVASMRASYHVSPGPVKVTTNRE